MRWRWVGGCCRRCWCSISAIVLGPRWDGCLPTRRCWTCLWAVDTVAGAGCLELRRISEAEVPLAQAEQSRFVLFREGDGLDEHVAVLIGQPMDWPDPLPVRLHSSCLTGDIFGSLRCDCGEQLHRSVGTIREMGGGVLLYLAQEGRGIGLANKLRAYTRQDAGLDTVAANHALGFPDDQRDFTIDVELLRQLDIYRIVLLTNIRASAMHSPGPVSRWPDSCRFSAPSTRSMSATWPPKPSDRGIYSTIFCGAKTSHDVPQRQFTSWSGGHIW